MAKNNLILISFTDEELKTTDDSPAAIQSVFASKKPVNLTPEQCQQHGRISEQNKLFVNKARENMPGTTNIYRGMIRFSAGGRKKKEEKMRINKRKYNLFKLL